MPTDATPSQAPPDAELLRLIFGKNVSMAIAVVAKLRVADLLADGPQTLADLAARTKTHAPSLYRVLRTLASVGVFAEQADGRFALTPMGEYLRTGVKGSLRGIADLTCSDWSWRPWSQMLETVRTGRAAFDSVFGESVFDYLGKHPDESAVFNEGMTGFYVERRPGRGRGVRLRGLRDGRRCRRRPRRAVEHDPSGVSGSERHRVRLPACRGRGRGRHPRGGPDGRCRAVGGDFFRGVPDGGDAYLMKHIIHDWSDDQATTILRNCRRGVNPGGKLLLIEMVVAPGDAGDLVKLIDLDMLVNLTGRERTEAEFRQLLSGAGWRLTRVLPTESPTQIVEAEPA